MEGVIGLGTGFTIAQPATLEALHVFNLQKTMEDSDSDSDDSLSSHEEEEVSLNL